MKLNWLAPPPEPVPSPCVGVCTLDDHGVCMGCARTTAEIAGWTTMSDADRQRVLEAIEERALRPS